MQPKRFRGRNMREAMLSLRMAMGEGAMVLSSRSVTEEGVPLVEIVAASSQDVAEYERRMEAPRTSSGRKGEMPRLGPFVLALVGPAGAGKTLTAVKLALSHHAFGKGSVGFVTLDTYRVGAVNELQTFAEIAGIPLEVVYNRKEIPGAFQRLRACDAIVLDTPGKTPGAMGISAPWEGLLKEMEPQETHLVLSAGMRTDVAIHMAAAFRGLGVTHLLPSKLDQVPADAGLAELVEKVKLPTRWITDGQDVPGDLRPAGARLLAAMGQIAVEVAEPIRAAHEHARRQVLAS